MKDKPFILPLILFIFILLDCAMILIVDYQTFHFSYGTYTSEEIYSTKDTNLQKQLMYQRLYSSEYRRGR